MDTLALSETLKLLFNLTQYYPHHVATFTKSLPNILKILSRAKIPSPPLQPPVTYLINSLLNLDLDSNKCKPSSPNPLFPKNDPQCNIDRLISILDSTVRLYTEEQSENLATPLVTLLRKIYELAPTPVKTHMQSLLLPSNDERTKPLGQSDTLAACLLRHFSSPLAPNLRESVSSMIFDLSDKNPTTFVRNVGYGFAAGYLATHNLAVPDDAMEKWNTRGSGDTEEDLGLKVTTSADGKDINPVTGQRRDMEPMDLGPDMTDEEKEREAEKLFVLFERFVAHLPTPPWKNTQIANLCPQTPQIKSHGRNERPKSRRESRPRRPLRGTQLSVQNNIWDSVTPVPRVLFPKSRESCQWTISAPCSRSDRVLRLCF